MKAVCQIQRWSSMQEGQQTEEWEAVGIIWHKEHILGTVTNSIFIELFLCAKYCSRTKESGAGDETQPLKVTILLKFIQAGRQSKETDMASDEEY